MPQTQSPLPRETSFPLVPLAEDTAPTGRWSVEHSFNEELGGATGLPLALLGSLSY